MGLREVTWGLMEATWGLREVTWDLREVIWDLTEVRGCPSWLNQGLRLFTMSLREVACGLKWANCGPREV